jgi:hypothetical protein
MASSDQGSTPLTGAGHTTSPPIVKMASIEGLTDAQNAALADVSVGSLIMLYHPCHDMLESDSESEDEDDEDDDEDDGEDDEEDEDRDEDEDEDGDEDEGEGEGEDEDEPVPRSARFTDETTRRMAQNLLDADHAEHIEHVSLSSVADGNNGDPPSDLIAITRNVSLVTGVTKDPNGLITDINVLGLEYQARPDDVTRSYQLYGNHCVANLPLNSAAPVLEFSHYVSEFYKNGLPLSVFRVMPEQTFTVAPTGDQVRRILHGGVCLAGCDEGLLASVDELYGLVKDYTVPTSNPDMRAVCPACVGIGLMKEHQGFRTEIENFLQVNDLVAVLDFYGRLNPRRTQLGYHFEQFDEREWNFLFDDMVAEDEDERSDGGYEPWDEANDPNGDVVPSPCPQASIDSLQIIKYATVKVDDDSQCIVCCEQFKDEQLIVKLRCKHIFCQGPCILEWLKNNDSCPLCRAQVSSEDDEKAADNAKDDEMPNAGEEPEKDQPLAVSGAYPYDVW